MDSSEAISVLRATFEDARLAYEQRADRSREPAEREEYRACAQLYRRALSHLGSGMSLEEIERTFWREARMVVSETTGRSHTRRTAHLCREMARVINYARRYV